LGVSLRYFYDSGNANPEPVGMADQ
jgi:hypothetical protein